MRTDQTQPASSSLAEIKKDAPLFAEFLNDCPNLAVFTRSSPSFSTLSQNWNRAIPITPLAIVQPQDEGEVQGVVRFCSVNNIPLSVRSGGHDFFGRSLAQDGIVLDMRKLNAVQVDKDTRVSAQIGGGIIAGELLVALEAQGLFTPTGWNATVGWVGWACGGGYGSFGGSYGHGVDQILGAKVVLADGTLVDTDQDPSLLWALKGAGCGTFGVVTEVRVKVYPLPRLLAGMVAFPLLEIEQVMNGLETLGNDGSIPNQLSGDACILNAPGAGALLLLLFAWADNDDLKQGYECLEKAKALGTVLSSTVQETSLSKFAYEAASHAPPGRFTSRSQSVPAMTSTLCSVLVGNSPPPGGLVPIHNNHGRGILDQNEPSGCFSNRSRGFVIGFQGGTVNMESTEEFQTAMEWAEGLNKQVVELKLGTLSQYGNFIPTDELDNTAVYGKQHLLKLRAVKRKLDPRNVFDKGWPNLDIGKVRQDADIMG